MLEERRKVPMGWMKDENNGYQGFQSIKLQPSLIVNTSLILLFIILNIIITHNIIFLS